MSIDQVTGIVLAGGRARRMGGVDKGLVDLDGAPMISHVVRRIRPQVSEMIISANRNLPEYRKWSNQVVADTIGEFDGPLAGMASGLELVETDFAVTVPCDSPLVSNDLVSRMYDACVSSAADIAVAHDGVRLQPVFALMQKTLGASIIEFLESGERKIDKWFERHDFIAVDFSDSPESFLNINTQDDKLHLLALERLYD
jgi:molybdopterin-guanine dinucleotide biosynthesis protein A